MPTYSEIYKMTDPKEKLFAAMDRINELRDIAKVGLSFDLQCELGALEDMKMKCWSDWKDPE